MQLKIIPDAIEKTINVTDPDIPIFTEIILGKDIAETINEIDSYNQKIPIIIKAQNEFEEFKNKNSKEITGSQTNQENEELSNETKDTQTDERLNIQTQDLTPTND